MAKILVINTAFEKATVSIAVDGIIIQELENDFQKNHASFLEPAIKKISEAASVSLNNLDAVAVINGPGSYTGLRVGLASAKALCYVLNKPLLLLNSLDVMAHALQKQVNGTLNGLLFCPLIDARRMEVYTALYNSKLELVKNYSAEIINTNFLQDERKENTIIAGGSGSKKVEKLIPEGNIIYTDTGSLASSSALWADDLFFSGKFSDIAYSEPFYLKEVYFINNNLYKKQA